MLITNLKTLLIINLTICLLFLFFSLTSLLNSRRPHRPGVNSSVPRYRLATTERLSLSHAVQAARRPDGQGLRVPWTSNQRNVMGGGSRSTQCHTDRAQPTPAPRVTKPRTPPQLRHPRALL